MVAILISMISALFEKLRIFIFYNIIFTIK
jgi:hypothetical protein